MVTPYYNKATQNGLIKMFSEIADKATAPVILYNVPSRTGVNIQPATVKALSEHPNISAIKEASGNISAVAEIAALCGDNINIYSGNDDQTVPIMSLGGKGCISVLSNLLPKESAEMCAKFKAGDVKGAAEMQLKYLHLINALFSEVNPIPVKAAMAAMGIAGEIAEKKRIKNGTGNATFRTDLIDAVFNLTEEELTKGARYEIF